MWTKLQNLSLYSLTEMNIKKVTQMWKTNIAVKGINQGGRGMGIKSPPPSCHPTWNSCQHLMESMAQYFHPCETYHILKSPLIPCFTCNTNHLRPFHHLNLPVSSRHMKFFWLASCQVWIYTWNMALSKYSWCHCTLSKEIRALKDVSVTIIGTWSIPKGIWPRWPLF